MKHNINIVTLKEQCHAYMMEKGLPFNGDLITDGKVHRYSATDDSNKKNEWYVAYDGVSSYGNPYLNVVFASWKEGGIKYEYKSFDRATSISSDERTELMEVARTNKLNAEKKIALEHDKAAQLAKEIWSKASENPPSDKYLIYTNDKGIKPTNGVRFFETRTGEPSIVVPLYNSHGEMRTLQFITKDSKAFLTGGEKRGNYHFIGEPEKSDVFFVGEGYATSVTIYEAVKMPTVVAFDAGNIQSAIESVSNLYPNAQFIIAADDDANATGIKKAKEAAAKFKCSVVVPEFPGSKRDNDTDFNDLAQIAGINAVRDQLMQAYTKSKVEQNKLITSTNGSSKMEIKFLSELPVNYLTTDAPPAPMLLKIMDHGEYKPFLRKGIVGQLVGAGGIGKTHFLTQLAIAVTLGGPFLNKYSIEESGNVFLGLGENSDDDIHRLLRKMTRSFSKEQCNSIAERLSVQSFTGKNSALIDNDGNPTDVYNSLLEALKTAGPWVLIILDPISRFLGAEAETDNAAATQFIALLERFTLEIPGKPLVLFGHHMNKANVGNSETDQTAARGSGALTDGVRWQANLAKKDSQNQTISLKVVKSNHTQTYEEHILAKDMVGILRDYSTYKPATTDQEKDTKTHSRSTNKTKAAKEIKMQTDNRESDHHSSTEQRVDEVVMRYEDLKR